MYVKNNFLGSFKSALKNLHQKIIWKLPEILNLRHINSIDQSNNKYKFVKEEFQPTNTFVFYCLFKTSVDKKFS